MLNPNWYNLGVWVVLFYPWAILKKKKLAINLDQWDIIIIIIIIFV